MVLPSLSANYQDLFERSKHVSVWYFANKKFRVPPTTQCNINASNKVSDNNSQAIVRRSENFFQPSIWHYDYIQSLSSEYKGDVYVEKSQMLREEVRMMLFKVENSVDQLELIDVLQRLGVAYHFNNEIRNMLDNIYNMMDNSKKDKNLYATALGFRLLRQHGYDVSTDMFLSFQDEMGNFSQHSSIDVEGMLSLYEASFLSFENETILDEAKDFTSKYLKEYLSKNNDENNDHHDHYLSLLINQALEIPLHWRIPRWEAQWFINAYEQKKNMNPLLLQLAKLDFNILQTIYQEELKVSSRWWKNTGLGDKLSFARDRMVENYIWTVGDIFEPQFANLRTVITKVNALITTIDDVYDVYGTFEELKLFTDVIERWDPFTIDNLPYYMKLCFLALYNFVNELAYEIFKDHGYNVTPYLQKSRENETGDFIKSIQCLMNENETSETDAHERIKSMLNIVWKKMNKEAHDSPLSKRFKEIAMNLGRMALCMYQHGDGHSIQYSQIKNRILSLLIQPIQDNIYV
ncbi:hypothetical protein AAHE18_19G177600 [Arachis hypogaea]